MALVEFGEGCGRDLQQLLVILTRKRRSVGVIAEQAEEEILFLVGQVADLQLLHLGAHRLRVRQHHRHDHQGAEGVGNSRILEIHFGQGAGRQQPRYQVIDHLDRQLAGRDQEEERQGEKDGGREPFRARTGGQGGAKERPDEQRAQAADPQRIGGGVVAIDPFQGTVPARFPA